jgi:hypothetical protein
MMIYNDNHCYLDDDDDFDGIYYYYHLVDKDLMLLYDEEMHLSLVHTKSKRTISILLFQKFEFTSVGFRERDDVEDVGGRRYISIGTS